MPHRITLGRSGLEVSPICYGSWQLSPRFWGMVKPKWRKHPAVLPIRFRIAEAGWPKVAEALGMPLGVYEATARAAAL